MGVPYDFPTLSVTKLRAPRKADSTAKPGSFPVDCRRRGMQPGRSAARAPGPARAGEVRARPGCCAAGRAAGPLQDGTRGDTRRGLSGRLERKLATGGLSFGYRTVPIVVGTAAHGQPVNDGFRIEVEPQHTALVRERFEGHALQGLGLRALARRMNAAGVPSPRSKGVRAAASRRMRRSGGRSAGASRRSGSCCEPHVSGRARLEPLAVGKGSRDGPPDAPRAAGVWPSSWRHGRREGEAPHAADGAREAGR